MRKVLVLLAGMVMALATAMAAEASPAPPSQAPAPASQAHVQRSCAAAPAGYAACNAWVRTDIVQGQGIGPAAATPSGLFPANLRSAYNLASLSASAGAGRTIGIVDAMDDPTAFNDVNVYRSQFGIPALASCTPSTINASTTPCFAKSNQTGGTTPPRVDGGWAQEISLDLDMASAICPNCNILLVEASSATIANLGTSVNTAVRLGADVVSNSYGGGEYSGETTDENTYFNHPGVAITASSGDSGFGVEFPAASRFVTAVGGTSLRTASNTRGWTETAWSGAGSGCSAFVAKPSWQTDTGCARRTVADVSAVADPATGVAVFDSTAFQGLSGWLVFGGTSVSSPIVASVYALTNTSSVNGANLPYAHTSSLNDVTSGSNGSCGGTYLCTARAGYDGPTGLGTPNGAGAF
ncbi:S53 family peptidase [Amycolatopsis taiwanensis]|uniref:Peptidase S8 n=1 Tax=Amycolatopsis taiwanensis TaxID=342230 RepID=A0A9W6QZK8_9PSEU|nr:S53 family peptidase [Amycolatopsis taiwanensis]GLY64887.1 peptidase S8 [Amycolatopsis taiwanensis]